MRSTNSIPNGKRILLRRSAIVQILRSRCQVKDDFVLIVALFLLAQSSASILLCCSPQYEIYFEREQCISTETCNSSLPLLWKPSRQNYLQREEPFIIVLTGCDYSCLAMINPAPTGR